MTIKQNVKALLEEDDYARNNDNVLLLVYWSKFNEGLAITPATSIIRARQLLNADGICLPTIPEVIKQRKIKEQNMKDSILNHNEVV